MDVERLVVMPELQIWFTNDDVRLLRDLMDYYEKQVEEDWGGLLFQRGVTPSGRRTDIRKPKVNKDYVVREAVRALWRQVTYEEKEKKKLAEMPREKPGFRKSR